MACTQCNACARTFKIIVLMIALCGLIFNIVGAWSCRFYFNSGTSISNVVLDKIGIQSDIVDVGTLRVGIFGYETINGTCKPWPDIFSKNSFGFTYYSQICISAAIACAIAGILATIAEIVCCNFVASCAFSLILFLAASGLELAAAVTFITGMALDELCASCTFGGPAAGWMFTSIFCYFLAGCMLCCIPRPDALLKANANEDAGQQQGVQQQQQRDIENVNNVVPVDATTPVAAEPVMAVTGVAVEEPVAMKTDDSEA